jgi:tetratricopeptide (TPR) repeat protein
LKLNRSEDATASYENAINLNPSSSTAWYGKGVAQNQSGTYNDALTSFNQSIQLSPSNAAAWHGKGLILKSLNSTQESEKALSKAEDLGYKNSTKPETL